MTDVRKGQVWNWRGVRAEVLRVARDGTWADLRVSSGMETWTKRQALPFPADFHHDAHDRQLS